MAPRFPGPEEAPRPGSFRTGRTVVREDYSGLTRGVSNLSAGLSNAAGSIEDIALKVKQRERASDIALAEAKMMEGYLDIQNRYSEDMDFENLEGKYSPELERVKAEAAALIRDERIRESWTSEAELKRIVAVDGIRDRAASLSQDNDRANMVSAMEANADMAADPRTPQEIRERLIRDNYATITTGFDTGIFTADQARVHKKAFAEDPLELFTINQAMSQIQNGGAQIVAEETQAASMLGTDTLGGALASANGGAMEIPLGLARRAAARLGDESLPDDDELAAEYLKARDKNPLYAAEVTRMVMSEYNNDVAAAIIATAPGSSDSITKKWLSSGRDDGVLPPPIRDYYRSILGKTSVPAAMTKLPIEAAPDVAIENFNVDLLDRFSNLQAAFGKTLPIVRSDSGEAIRFNIEGLPPDEVARLVRTAGAMGYGGLVLDGDTITLDLGERSVATDGKVPPEVAVAIEEYERNDNGEVPIAVTSLPAKYKHLSFDQLMQLSAQAKAQVEREAVQKQAGIQSAVTNAPSAIAASGTYTGYDPTAADFVYAFGSEGVQRFKAYKAAKDVARTTHGMRSMPYSEIEALVEAAQPTDTGENAALEQARFENIAAAYKAIKTEREADPFASAINAFPEIGAMFEDLERGDVDGYNEALIAVKTAQEKLGIPANKQQLLPTGAAKAVADVFNDVTLRDQDRIAAVTQAALTTNDPDMQRAIVTQLKRSGVPAFIEPVLEATLRNDINASNRLFKAAMFDASKVKAPNHTDAQITAEVQSKIFANGTIGDIVNGTYGGTAESHQRAVEQMALIERHVKINLLANMPMDQAIEQAKRDVFGDVKVLAGTSGARVVIPGDEDENLVRNGFSSLRPTVKAALDKAMLMDFGKVPLVGFSKALTIAIRDYEVANVMAEGYFAMAGEGEYVYVYPATGMTVPGADGKPLTFNLEQVKTAGANPPEYTREPGRQSWPTYMPNAF